MRMLLDMFGAWPMPLVWAMAAALLLRRRGRALLTVAALLLVVSSLPIVGRTLLAPLSAGAVVAEALSPDHGAAAIVVPTAGSFRDAAGRWWPEDGSIGRAVAGVRLQERLGLPLVIVGGTPYAAQPAEAATVAQTLALGPPGVRVVADGRDSAESAAAVAAALAAGERPVILLTDATHIARMRASLRHHGVGVAASVVNAPFVPDDVVPPAGFRWRDLVPARSGLTATGAALREYVGIAWYLASERIGLSDL